MSETNLDPAQTARVGNHYTFNVFYYIAAYFDGHFFRQSA